jgi:hypothetical protein
MQERLGDQSGAFESMKTASAQSTDAFLSFAWMRAASPKAELRDPAAALADAEATQPAGVHAAMVYDVNAVALAANGRFDEAVLANERALEACRQSRVKDLPEIKAAIARLERRGNLYRARQPYVGPSSDMTPTLARQSGAESARRGVQQSMTLPNNRAAGRADASPLAFPTVGDSS